ncbi:unnamed protein product [Brassica oleracea var. botrytis]|uniref:Uncharacterized protein n=2 Tax=Brassica oleracea TaxID=3712 RepID=A0A0D3D1A2_BRAOL|nr:unnamed protein product [Brassica oleracea]
MKETSRESFELPPEIIMEILIRLPDKSTGEAKVERLLMVNTSQSPCVYSLSGMKESAATKFKTFQIHVDWMLENGITSQRLEAVRPEEEELIVQGVRFAFRVHQFAGGFDAETSLYIFKVIHKLVYIAFVLHSPSHVLPSSSIL